MSMFSIIRERAATIARKAEDGNATARDVAELMELYQQTVDGIDELMDSLPAEPPLIVRIDGQTALKFNRDADAMARWIVGIME